MRHKQKSQNQRLIDDFESDKVNGLDTAKFRRLQQSMYRVIDSRSFSYAG